MRKTVLSADAAARLIALRYQGRTLREIGAEFGVSKPTARQLLMRYRYEPPSTGQPKIAHSWSKKHGLSGTRTHRIWRNMKQRCGNPNNPKWKHYGGRGITVCDRWASLANFAADMGEAPAGMELDRINNDLGYFKENCRWATRLENCNNMRTNVFYDFAGEKLTLREISRRTGLSRETIRSRIGRLGWTFSEAVSAKPNSVRHEN